MCICILQGKFIIVHSVFFELYISLLLTFLVSIFRQWADEFSHSYEEIRASKVRDITQGKLLTV